MSTQDQSAHDRRETPGAATTADQPESARHHVPKQASGYRETSGRTGPSAMALGFTRVAGILMLLTGLNSFFEGLVSGLNGHFFVARSNYPFAWSVHGWGWVNIVIGVALFASGVALLMNRTWAKVVAVVIASFSVVANFLFIPYYSVWPILLIALNLIIIWAVVSPTRESWL